MRWGVLSRVKMVSTFVAVAVMMTACGSTGTSSGASPSSKATSAGRASKAQVTLNVGYIPSLTAAGVPAVGQALGLWNKVPGVRFKFIPFTTGPAETAALAGGSIDLENIGGGPAMLGVAGYGKIVAVDNILGDNYVLGQTRDGITSIAALKGKTIGYPQGTTAQLLLAVALHANGMSMASVKGINMQPATIVSAMSSNEIQGAAIYLPFAASIINGVSGAKIVGRLANYPNLVLPQFWAASNRILARHPQAVQAFLKAAGKAIDYRASHLKQAVQDVFKFTKAPSAKPFQEQASAEKWITSKQILADYQNGTAKQWVSQLLSDLNTYGIVHTAVTASSLTDFGIDAAALKSSGG